VAVSEKFPLFKVVIYLWIKENGFFLQASYATKGKEET